MTKLEFVVELFGNKYLFGPLGQLKISTVLAHNLFRPIKTTKEKKHPRGLVLPIGQNIDNSNYEIFLQCSLQP